MNSEKLTHDLPYIIENQESFTSSQTKFLKIKDHRELAQSEDIKKTIYEESNQSELDRLSFPEIESTDAIREELKDESKNAQKNPSNIIPINTDNDKSELIKERKSILSGLFGRKSKKADSKN